MRDITASELQSEMYRFMFVGDLRRFPFGLDQEVRWYLAGFGEGNSGVEFQQHTHRRGGHQPKYCEGQSS